MEAVRSHVSTSSDLCPSLTRDSFFVYSNLRSGCHHLVQVSSEQCRPKGHQDHHCCQGLGRSGALCSHQYVHVPLLHVHHGRHRPDREAKELLVARIQGKLHGLACSPGRQLLPCASPAQSSCRERDQSWLELLLEHHQQRGLIHLVDLSNSYTR